MRRFVACSLFAALLVGACAGSERSPSPPPTGPPPSVGPAADVEASAEATAEVSLEAPAGASLDPGAATSADKGYAQRHESWRLVTLGDAYTHGTSTDAPRRDSWPAQLVDAFARNDVELWLWNLAEGSHTSTNLLEEQLGQVGSLQPDVLTVQVGVNDILADETDWYRGNVTLILDQLLTILPAERIFAITSPDHTLTEWGDSFGPREAGSAAVAALNETLREVAVERGITVIDIAQVNDRVAGDASLVIEDGPYPTAKQYAGWVEVIGPYLEDALLALQP